MCATKTSSDVSTVQIRPTARLGLTREHLTGIHQSAVELATRVGFQVENDVLLSRLKNCPGVRLQGSRVYPSPEKIEAYVVALRARHGDAAPDRNAKPILGTSDRPLHIVADDDVSLRPMTREDAIVSAKLCEMLYDSGVRGGACGLPSDVDPRMAPFEQVLIGLRHSRSGGGSSHAFTLWHAQYMEQISRVRGQPFGLSIWMPSPFRLGGNELDIAMGMEGRFATLGVGSMPLMGVTAPMSEMKTWIQALAESLGAASLLSDVFPNVPIHVYPHPKPADMRTCGYAMGTPELNLMDVLKSEILPFYGLQPPWGKCCSLGAVYAGPQSTFERTASYLIGYLHGYRVFDEGGILNGGEVFSPVQLLFDIEILSWAERYGRGVCWTASQLDLDRWVEMATRGDLFAENPNEVALLRTVYDRESRFFPVHSVGQHIANRQDPIRDAKERIRCLVAAHVYEPDPGLIKEVERIVEHARQHPPR